MYKAVTEHQITFYDFNQSCGMQLDKSNEWVLLAERIPWEQMEKEYAAMFPSKTGHPAISLRTALGSLIIQNRKQLSDRKLVKEISENPYLQYFIGNTRFEKEEPFRPTSLVAFRKRLDVRFLMRANDLCLENAPETPAHDKKNESRRAKQVKQPDEHGNLGTAILDATVSPQNIRYPQDFSLLNEAREKLQTMIDAFHKLYHPWKKPRTYRRVARKEYLALAKSKKRTAKKVRAYIRRDLGRVKRDLGYLEDYMAEGYAMPEKYINQYLTILELYRQQKYMFDNKTHTVENRIVSISQPFVRPVVRGKAKAHTEFGAKYDISIDEKGHARLEEISFDPYNESSVFQDAVTRYFERTGHYPRRVLADQIYRTRDNLAFCKEYHIELSGPKLGRPAKDKKQSTKDEWQDNTDRIEVERFFSVDKRCNGAGLIMTKLEQTAMTSIAMAVLVTNLFAVPMKNFFVLYFQDCTDGIIGHHLLEFDDAA